MSFRKIISWLQGFGDFIDWILRIGVAISVASAIGIAILQWVSGIDPITLGLLVGTLFGVMLVILSFMLRWHKNRSSKTIPDLLLQMDEKMKCLIGTAVPDPEKAKQFIKDAGELWNIDTHKIQVLASSNNIAELKTMVKESETKPSPFPHSSPQPFTIISNFLQSLRGLMVTDGVGTDTIKDQEYVKLDRRLETLKKRLPSSRSIRTVDRYLMWWHGSNHWRLFKHYGDNPVIPSIMPAKAKAAMPQFDFLLELAVNEYLGYVKDAIYGKEVTKEEWKPIEKMESR